MAKSVKVKIGKPVITKRVLPDLEPIKINLFDNDKDYVDALKTVRQGEGKKRSASNICGTD